MPSPSKQVLDEVERSLAEMENAINSHPKATSDLYKQYKAAFLRGAEKAEQQPADAEWARSVGLNCTDLAILHKYLFAGSFISAWHATHRERREQSNATNQYCSIAVVAFHLPEDDVLEKFVEYEDMWQKVLPRGGLGCAATAAKLIFVLLLVALVCQAWK